VALYGEFPQADVASQFWDCNINIIFLKAWNAAFPRTMTKTHRIKACRPFP